MSELRVETLTLPGAPLGPENPLPMFREPLAHREVKTDGSLPPDKLARIGMDTGFRVLPYRMQDQYTRQLQPLPFKAIILENDFLKATFLPELGGRLISLFDKTGSKELLFFNPHFQPANLAIRNAWFAGGIEWNIGQYGHTFHTCSSLFAAKIPGFSGESGLRLYEFERCKHLWWQIDFYLPPASHFLLAYTRVINPRTEPTSMYWWTNIAIPENETLRVLAPASHSIYLQREVHGFGLAEMPYLPSVSGKDATYPLNFPFANEFFFQCDETCMPWETGLDETGHGLVEASTPRLRFRKMFCWGSHSGGRHWQEFLAKPGMAYVEIQGGLAPTQVHGLEMPANTSWDWTQALGSIEVDPSSVHQASWSEASGAVERELFRRLSPTSLAEFESAARSHADTPPLELLHSGSGWGALEQIRLQSIGEALPSSAFSFPDPSGPEQKRWIELLTSCNFPSVDPQLPPGEWMVQSEWQALLESYLSTDGNNWFAWLHLGVMRMEQGDQAGAKFAWEKSFSLVSNAWAARNLAVLSRRQNDSETAHIWYQHAWDLSIIGAIPVGLAVEYLQELLDTGHPESVLLRCNELPEQVHQSDRVLVLEAQAALQIGHLDRVKTILEHDFALIREGELSLSDFWFDYWSQRELHKRWADLDGNQKIYLQKKFPPPSRIDFRMEG